MTSLMGPRLFVPGDRFFKLAEYITIYLDMETYAVCASQGEPVRPPGRYFAVLISKLFPIHIRYNVFGPFWAAFKPIHILNYEFTFVTASPRPMDKILTSAKWGAIAEMFWNTSLIFFYEQHRPWIQNTLGSQPKDMDRWPPIFRFAWALRNAAAHHGGKLNITDPRVPPITWHHLKYDHRDAGLRIFGDVMNVADMLIFLIEMSDELDRVGCPQFG
jgi:hypothetical protein